MRHQRPVEWLKMVTSEGNITCNFKISLAKSSGQFLALILLDVLATSATVLVSLYLKPCLHLASRILHAPSFLPTSLVAPFLFPFAGFPSTWMPSCWHVRGLSLWSSSSRSALNSLVISSSLMALNTIYMLMSISTSSSDLSSKLQLYWTSHSNSLLRCLKDVSNSCPNLNSQSPLPVLPVAFTRSTEGYFVLPGVHAFVPDIFVILFSFLFHTLLAI